MYKLYLNGFYSYNVRILYYYLKTLAINTKPKEIKSILEEHPQSNTFLALSDTLSNLRVENIALEIEADNLLEIPSPFILMNNQNEYVIITAINKDGAQSVDANGKHKQFTITELKEIYSGKVLLGQQNKNIGLLSKTKVQSEISLRQILILSLTLVVFLKPYLSSNLNPSLFIYTILKQLGCIISLIIVSYKFDKNNPLGKVFCGKTSQGCNKILDSKGNSFWGISYSEIGFTYFGGTLLAISFISTTAIYSYLFLISLLSTPFIVYSLSYQAFVAKHWCRLCLTIIAILSLEIVIAWIHFQEILDLSSNIDYKILMDLFLLVALVVLALTISIPLLSNTSNLKFYKKAFKRLLYKPEVFQGLLKKQPIIPHDNAFEAGIQLGNPDAKNKLIKVCNLYCNPCAKSHPEIMELLNRFPDKIQVIIMYLNLSEPSGQEEKTLLHLLTIDAEKKTEITINALNSWYGHLHRDFETFKSTFPVSNFDNKSYLRIKEMTEWSAKVGIAHTPTYFLNNHELPGYYNINDLKYLLD